MKPIIEVKGVSKQIKNKTIIRDVSFTIQEGAIVGLLGPNGSGKTTMIRLLNGVIDATKGAISVFDQNIQEAGQLIRSQTGIVTETTALYHEMTALENLRFFASLYEVEEEAEERIESLLKDFGIWAHRNEYLGSFSTGMKKRVALCKALLPKPKVLFLDEPTNGLDPEGIQFVFTYLKKLREKEQVTIIICTHVLAQLEGFCDTFLFLKNGEVLASGTKQEMEKKYLKNYQVFVRCGLEDSRPCANYTFTSAGEH